MREHEQEDHDQIIPRRPMPILVLPCVRDLRLRGIVSGLECHAGVVITTRITQRKMSNGRVATVTHMHGHDGKMSFEVKISDVKEDVTHSPPICLTSSICAMEINVM